MKRRVLVVLILRLIPLFASLPVGCSPQSSSPSTPQTNAPPARSAVVDVITQRATVEAGLRARDRIRELDAAQRQKINTVLEPEDSGEH